MKFRLNGKEFDNQKDYRKALKESEDRDNSYELWSNEDDSKLLEISEISEISETKTETKSISELADHLKRTELGIVSRLAKLVPSYEIRTEFHANGLKKNEGLFYGKNYLRYLTEWFENGHKKSEGNYINYDNRPHGKKTEWYENGQIWSEGEYKTIDEGQEGVSTIKVGKHTVWFENGHKKSEGSFYDCWGTVTDEEKGTRLNHWYRYLIHYDHFGYTVGDYQNYDDDVDDEPLFAKIDKWTEWYGNGQKKSEGRYKNLYYDGKWTFWYENGQKKAEGRFRNGYQLGRHIKWYENGQNKSEYSYEDLEEYEADSEYKGYSRGLSEIDISKYRVGGVLAKHTEWDQDGQIISNMTYKDGNYYNGSFISNNSQWSTQGAYKKNKKEGKWIISTIDKNFPVRLKPGPDSEPNFNAEVYIFDDYSKREVNFKNNKKNGEETYWSLSGHKSHQYNFKDDLQNGIQISWYENGQIESESYYIKGFQQDKETRWHESGQIWKEGIYKDDKLDGKWIFWYENGQKDKEENYTDGKKHGKTTGWYENGQIFSEEHYKDGKKDGKWTNWYGSDEKSEAQENLSQPLLLPIALMPTIAKETHYKDDKKHGTFTKCYASGLKEEAGNFKDGKKEGHWTSWDKDGQIISINSYKDGVELEDDIPF